MTTPRFPAGLAAAARGAFALALAVGALAPLAHAQDKPGTVAAPFLLMGTDARGLAMGSAQTAAARGAEALHWNPAGIADPTARGTGSAVFSTQRWIVDTQHSFVGATLDGGTIGTFGLSVTALDYGDEPVTTEERPDGTGELYSALDLAVGVSYARALTQQFSVGATAKLVRQQIWNESASGAALDLGVRYETGFRGLVIGATMSNFGSDLRMAGRDLRRRYDQDPESTGDDEEIPANLEVDAWPIPLAFGVGISAEAVRSGDLALTVSAEGQAPSDNSQSANFGAELAYRDLVYVRGGYRQAFSSIAEDGGWSAGFGLQYDLDDALGVRFGYVMQEVEPFGTPQMFSLGMTF